MLNVQLSSEVLLVLSMLLVWVKLDSFITFFRVVQLRAFGFSVAIARSDELQIDF